MSVPHHLLLLFWLILSNYLVSNIIEVDADFVTNNNKNIKGVSFELIHRHSPKLKSESKFIGPPKSRFDRIKQLVQSDNARQQILSLQCQRRRMRQQAEGNNILWIDEHAAEIPMRSGADVGEAEYFVSFRIGSPRPQKFVLVADTASDLTWMNCKYLCKDCPPSNPHPGRVFLANQSPSFRTIPCSSATCQDDLYTYHSLPDCPSPNAPCLFNYGYAGGMKAIGVFANETVTVGVSGHQKVRLFNVVIGCTESFNATSNIPDGVMGLGYSKHSFALRLADIFGNKFSYCLVDHLSASNLNNYLSFGNAQHMDSPKLQYTDLLLDYIGSYYCVNISGISVGGTMLDIPLETWNVTGEGGAIVDSGSSLTMLVEAAYDAVVTAFNATLVKYKRIELSILEYCFDDQGFDESTVPNFVIHFADGAKFEPPVKSYVINVAKGINCLGFLRTAWPGQSIIGNILQQNHYWEYDLGRAKLGFGPSSCIIPN